MTTSIDTSQQAELKGEFNPESLPKFKFVTDLPMRSLQYRGDALSPDELNESQQGLRIIEVKQDDARASDGKKRVRLTASSNAFDLVNDVMSKNALERMKAAAVGTTIFLNHDATVPESVFGAVEATEYVTRNFSVQSAEGKMVAVKVLCLDFDVIVTEKNPRAIQTWEQIDEGVVKLGASVTIAIIDKSPASGGGRQIDDVIYLETSVVGIPCNQTAWVQHVKSKSWVHQAKSVLRERDKLALPPILSFDSQTVGVEEILQHGETHKNAAKTVVVLKDPSIEQAIRTHLEKSEKTPQIANPGKRSFAKRSTKKEQQQNMSDKLRKAIAEASTVQEAKDIFSEALQEHFDNPWLYVYLMEDCLVELMYFNSNMSTDDKITSAKEMFVTFQGKMLEVLSAYFSDDEDEKSVQMRKAFDLAVAKHLQVALKEGRRNNKGDQEVIQEMHQMCLSLGAACASEKGAVTPSDAKKSDSVEDAGLVIDDPDETEVEKGAVTEEQIKTLSATETLQVKKKALRLAVVEKTASLVEREQEITGLNTQVKELTIDVAFWKASAESATAMLEKELSNPAVRPGASVS